MAKVIKKTTDPLDIPPFLRRSSSDAHAKKAAPKKLRRDHPRRLPQRSTGRATK
jgi:hypothetical protein